MAAGLTPTGRRVGRKAGGALLTGALVVVSMVAPMSATSRGDAFDGAVDADGPGTAASTTPAPAASAAPGAASPAPAPDDVVTVQRLLRQRQQSVDLAELASGRSDDPAVVALAGRLAARAEPELDRLQDLLWRWQADATGVEHHPLEPEPLSRRAAPPWAPALAALGESPSALATATTVRVAPAVTVTGGPVAAEVDADPTSAAAAGVARAPVVACLIPTARLTALADLRGAAFDLAFQALLRRHESSSALANGSVGQTRLGPEATAALRRADQDQKAVLTELASWPRVTAPATGSSTAAGSGPASVSAG